MEKLRQTVGANQDATSGVLSTATTLTELLAGFFVVLFTLFFSSSCAMGQIWQFLCLGCVGRPVAVRPIPE